MLLPLDVIGVIAEHLVAQDLHRTCASLNITSKAVKEETTSILWRRVLYKWNNGPSSKKKSAVKWRTAFGSESAKYIQ
jgi:hypothetical protein